MIEREDIRRTTSASEASLVIRVVESRSPITGVTAGNLFATRDARLSFRTRAMIFEECRVSVRACRTSPPMYPVAPVLKSVSWETHRGCSSLCGVWTYIKMRDILSGAVLVGFVVGDDCDGQNRKEENMYIRVPELGLSGIPA